MAFLGRIANFLSRVYEKMICSYILSRIPHGKNGIIRGKGTFQGNIRFGNDVIIGTNSIFLSTEAKLSIGNKVVFGPHVFIVTGDHQVDKVGEYITDVHEKTKKLDSDVTIEDDVWIGAGVIILKGVTIARGSVIGAGSVVTKDTKPYSINAGNPCRFIKSRFTEEQIKEHETILFGKSNEEDC